MILSRRYATVGVAVGLWLGILLGGHTPGTATSGPENDPSAVIQVELNGGELTVDVRNAPLAQVLRTIGEAAGIHVALHGDFSTPVTLSFAGVALEEGIRRLARGHPVAAAYAEAPDGPGPVKLTEVWVMDASSGARGASHARPSSLDSRPPSLEAQAEATVAAGEPRLVPQFSQIQRLAGDADRGSEAATARLAEIGASDADAALREQAVAALGRLTNPAVEPVLVAALADTDVDVRLRAIRGLRRFGTDTAVQSIAEVSLADTDPHVRLAAVTALTSLPGGSMLRGLAQASSDPDDVVREVAIRGLAWWNTRQPIAR